MATRNYHVGSGYQLIVGSFFEKTDLEIKGNGSNAKVSIESTQLQGINIPTTLTGNVGGGASGAFLATLINNGISFVGSTGSEIFDASKYIGNVKFNGFGGQNVLKGASGSNVFTHDYANKGYDIIVGGQDKTVTWKKFIIFGPTESKTYQATNELVVDGEKTASDLFEFVGDGDDFEVYKDASTRAIKAVDFDGGKVIVNGFGGDDTADVTEHAGVIKFLGGKGDDTLAFQHGTSGAGTDFNGGDGIDTLVVYAQNSGSALAVDDSALSTLNPTVLVTLDDVEKVVFHGSGNADIFDASAFTHKSDLNGGNGADVLKASLGGSNITGGNGADEIHLDIGADRVIYDANGQSTLAQRDEVHGFNVNADKFVFTHDNEIEVYNQVFHIPFVGTEIRIQDGIVEYRASQLSAWKTDLEDLSFGDLGINSLETAAYAVALAAKTNRIAAFEYDETWYVIEAGSGANVDNLIQLVGTTLNANSDLAHFVEFLPDRKSVV